MGQQQKKKDIGAIWKKTSKGGLEFMSGVLELNGEKHEIVIFANTYKERDNQPDFKIYPSTPRTAPSYSPQPRAGVMPQDTGVGLNEVDAPSFDDSDVPF